MAGRDNPEIKDVIRATGAGQRRWTCMPAIVQSYDVEAITAKVKPAVRLRDLKSGVAYEPSELVVPVGWPVMFGGAIVIQGELRQGDEVVLHVADAAIQAWLTQGGIVDGSGAGRRLGSSWAEPRGLSVQRRPGSVGGRFVVGRADGTATIITTVDGPGEILVQAPSVKLGAEASAKRAVGRDDDPVSIGATQLSWLNSVGAATMVGAFPASTIGTLSATSVEVESA